MLCFVYASISCGANNKCFCDKNQWNLNSWRLEINKSHWIVSHLYKISIQFDNSEQSVVHEWSRFFIVSSSTFLLAWNISSYGVPCFFRKLSAWWRPKSFFFEIWWSRWSLNELVAEKSDTCNIKKGLPAEFRGVLCCIKTKVFILFVNCNTTAPIFDPNFSDWNERQLLRSIMNLLRPYCQHHFADDAASYVSDCQKHPTTFRKTYKSI